VKAATGRRKVAGASIASLASDKLCAALRFASLRSRKLPWSASWPSMSVRSPSEPQISASAPAAA